MKTVLPPVSETFPPKAPRLLLVGTAVFILAGLLVSPKVLIALGPLSASLQSTVEGVQETALLEVNLFRVVALLLGVACGITWLMWKRLTGTPVYRSLYAQKIPEWIEKPDSTLVNGVAIAGVLFLVASGVHLLVSESILDRETLISLHKEDGVMEYATAIIFFLCSAACVFLATRFRAYRLRMLVHLLFAFGFFMLAGEEVSWGQRIFGFETVDFLAGKNVQNENNLHNLFGYAVDHLAILTVFLYGFFLPVLARAYPDIRRLLFVLGIPIASLGLAFSFLATSMIHHWTVEKFIEPLPGLRTAELRELLTSVMFALLLCESWSLSRRLGRADEEVPAEGD